MGHLFARVSDGGEVTVKHRNLNEITSSLNIKVSYLLLFRFFLFLCAALTGDLTS